MSLAVSLAISLNISNFILEDDSLIVIMTLQHLSLVLDQKIENIIADSIAMILLSSSWKARKVHRNVNFCTHHVAYWATARAYSGCILTHLPHSPYFPFCSGKDLPLLVLFLFVILWFWLNLLPTKKKKNLSRRR